MGITIAQVPAALWLDKAARYTTAKYRGRGVALCERIGLASDRIGGAGASRLVPTASVAKLAWF